MTLKKSSILKRIIDDNAKAIIALAGKDLA